jgi:hypothetical protein
VAAGNADRSAPILTYAATRVERGQIDEQQ